MKLLKKIKGIFGQGKRVWLVLSCVVGSALLLPTMALAGPALKDGLGMSQIEGNVTGSLQSVAGIIHAVAILGGIAFFVAFAFKAKQHRDNPTQVTIGQPLMYLFLAICLTMLPFFISTSKHVIYGDKAVAQWSDGQMTGLFGATSVTPASS